jgi:syntaxin 16
MSSSSSSSSGLLLDSKLPMRDLTGKYARFRNEFFLSTTHSHTHRLHSSPAPASSLSGPLLPLGGSSTLDLEDRDGSGGVTLRPEWADIHDTVEADMRQVKEAISALKTLHKTRCGINFNDDEVKQQESEIEILTQSITSKLRKCETGIKRIALVGDVGHLSQKERNVRLNSMRMLAQDLSAHSKSFRHAQKDFLRALNEQANAGSKHGFTDDAVSQAIDESHLDESLSEEQRQALEEINMRSGEREKEIIRIAKSIHELATLFSELNVLVIEQGTVLDRIDYNIEQTLSSVTKGVKELDEAEKISRRALTCKCIAALFVVIVILIIILVVKHRN